MPVRSRPIDSYPHGKARCIQVESGCGTMRIAIVNRHLRDGAGGSELQCDLIARGLVERGHEVTYVVSSPGAADLSDLPYGCSRAGSDPKGLLDATLASEPDVVYWRLNRLGLAPFLRGWRRTGVPVVFAASINDDVVPWPEERWPDLSTVGVRGFLSEVRSRTAHRAGYGSLREVAVLTVQREDFLGRAPVARQRVVRNVVSPERASFSWPRPYVAWVANLKPRKRPELLPVIAERLASHGVDLLVAGAVRDQRYRGLLAREGVPPNLHDLGVLDQEQVNGLLAGARLVAMTSEEEGFSNVLIHAWWSGVPTVSLEHDPDALIAREGLGHAAEGDLGGFLTAVERFATDPEGARTAGSRAAALARRIFDRDTNLDALEDALRLAVGTKSD
jgi:glycosyltransferase involved in cell wall biosynthesis